MSPRINPQNIPTALCNLRQWVNWKQEDKHKIPYSPWKNGKMAKTNDTTTWGTFQQALHNLNNNFDGIGIMFAGELVGIDLDHVIEGENISEWAAELMLEVSSYTERSPSGNGLHILCYGRLPAGRRKVGQIEMYDSSSPRFFTITGDTVGSLTTIYHKQTEINNIHAKYLGESHLNTETGNGYAQGGGLTDNQILNKAMNSAHGQQFRQLWDGNTSGYRDDASRADFALCRYLAFWTGKNPDSMDRLFRQSGLIRAKWDDVHSGDGKTYGQMTIANAINATHNSYGQTALPAPPPSKTTNSPINSEAIPNKPALTINLKEPKTTDYIKALGWLGYEFKMRQLDNVIFVNGIPITDSKEERIFNQMRDLGLSSRTWVRSAWMEIAEENSFHPIKDYLNGLEWDGTAAIDNFVDTYLEEKTGFGKICFRRWMVGSIAKVLEKAQNFMMVWDGPQDIGKSTLANWLCPLPEYFLEDSIRPEDKDYLVRLCNHWIWEVAELQATTRKADREALKSFITKRDVEVRKAFARNDLISPALASLVGTINEDGSGFLSDPTGNRRFVVIYIKRINWSYQEIPVHNLWAHAMHLYRSGGYGWKLGPDEAQTRDSINQRYQHKSIIAEVFDEHYVIDYANSTEKWTASTDIVQTLENNGLRMNQQLLLNELGRLMKMRNVTECRPRSSDGRRPSGWKGVHLIECGQVVERWQKVNIKEVNL